MDYEALFVELQRAVQQMVSAWPTAEELQQAWEVVLVTTNSLSPTPLYIGYQTYTIQETP